MLKYYIIGAEQRRFDNYTGERNGWGRAVIYIVKAETIKEAKKYAERKLAVLNFDSEARIKWVEETAGML